MRDVLLRLDGVGDITIFGEREYSLRVWLDPEQARRLRPDLGRRGRGAPGAERAGRRRRARPAAGARRTTPSSSSCTTQGRFEDPRAVPRRSSCGPRRRAARRACRTWRASNSARSDYVTNSYLNGKPAVALGDLPAAGHQRARRRRRDHPHAWRSSKQDFPPGIDYTIVYNPTEFIADIDRARSTRRCSRRCSLVVLVVHRLPAVLAHRDHPDRRHPGVADRHLRGDGGVRLLAQHLTLFGLVLAIGIVVDDAIVVVENVERNIARGHVAARRRAQDDGRGRQRRHRHRAGARARCSFRPPSSPASRGQFYRQFALTIAVSTLISAFNSLTLSPALARAAAQAARPTEPPRNPAGAARRAAAATASTAASTRTARGYSRAVGGTRAAQGCLACCRSMSGSSRRRRLDRQRVPARLHPGARPGLCHRRRATARRRVAVAHRRGRAARARRSCARRPASQDAVAFAGFSGATFTNASNAAAIFARFKPFEERIAQGSVGRCDHRRAVRPPAGDRGGLHHRHPAAAGARPRQCRRLQVQIQDRIGRRTSTACSPRPTS